NTSLPEDVHAVDRLDDVFHEDLVRAADEREPAARAAHGADQSLVRELIEDLREEVTRDVFRLGDLLHLHGASLTVRGQVSKCPQCVLADGGEEHALLQLTEENA